MLATVFWLRIFIAAELLFAQFGACLNQTAAEQKMLFLPNSKTPMHFQKMPKATKLLACLHCHHETSNYTMVAAALAY